jgi:Bacterial capsule synthesis protein PGA_cap
MESGRLNRNFPLPMVGVVVILAVGILSTAQTKSANEVVGIVQNPLLEWLLGYQKHNKVSADEAAIIPGRDPRHILVLVGGDTDFGESYQEEYAGKTEGNILVQKGYEYGIEHLSTILKAADFRILNLETPLTTHHQNPLPGKNIVHYSDPTKTLKTLCSFGPIAYSLANNHALDQGTAGLDETRSSIEAAHAYDFGAGKNIGEARKPLLQRLRVGDRQLTLAIFGGLEHSTRYEDTYHYYATAARPGVAELSASSLAALQQTIRDLRKREPNLYVIYFMHSLANYHWKTTIQAENAHALEAAGTDLVVGAGAHMMQEIEHWNRRWIFYSVGNFIFNSNGAYAKRDVPAFSLPLLIDFSVADGRIQAWLRAYPIVSDNRLTNFQPRFVTDEEFEQVHSLLAQKSGWDGATKTAVKEKKDQIGDYLEFSPGVAPPTAR